MCGVLHAYMCTVISEEVDGMGTFRTIVIDGCNLCWELNQGPLEEQPALLTDEIPF